MANTLIDPSIPEGRSLLRVLKGFHDLHRFAYDFWGDQIINFIILHLTRNKEITTSDLHLLGRFKVLGRGAEADRAEEVVVQLSPEQLEQLSALQQLPEIQELVRRFLCFRVSLRSEEYAAMSVEGM
jgi:hypothetical protein